MDTLPDIDLELDEEEGSQEIHQDANKLCEELDAELPVLEAAAFTPAPNPKAVQVIRKPPPEPLQETPAVDGNLVSLCGRPNGKVWEKPRCYPGG